MKKEEGQLIDDATVENSVLTRILVDDETNPNVLTLSSCLAQIKMMMQ